MVIIVAGVRVGQSVSAAGRDGVQILGDARGVLGRLRGAQGGSTDGRRTADRERDRVRGHAGQRAVAGPGAGGRAGRAGGHVLGTGRPQRRVRDTASAVGATERARAPRGQRAEFAGAAGAGAACGQWRAAERRALQQPAVVLVNGAREELEVFEHLRARIARGTHASTPSPPPPAHRDTLHARRRQPAPHNPSPEGGLYVYLYHMILCCYELRQTSYASYARRRTAVQNAAEHDVPYC